MPLSVGSKAPDFSLKSRRSGTMSDVTLSENFGRKNTVLLFFPLAFSSVCTDEMCSVSTGLEDYEKLNAEVIGISVDSPYALEAWAQAKDIRLKLASDLNKTTTKAYDVLFENMAGAGAASARAAFVIDKDGVIQYAEQTPTPKDLPDFNAIKAKLAELN